MQITIDTKPIHAALDAIDTAVVTANGDETAATVARARATEAETKATEAEQTAKKDTEGVKGLVEQLKAAIAALTITPTA